MWTKQEQNRQDLELNTNQNSNDLEQNKIDRTWNKIDGTKQRTWNKTKTKQNKIDRTWNKIQNKTKLMEQNKPKQDLEEIKSRQDFEKKQK